jgi:hypothetical protein
MVDSVFNILISIINFSTKTAFIILKAPVSVSGIIAEGLAASVAWAFSFMFVIEFAAAFSSDVPIIFLSGGA